MIIANDVGYATLSHLLLGCMLLLLLFAAACFKSTVDGVAVHATDVSVLLLLMVATFFSF